MKYEHDKKDDETEQLMLYSPNTHIAYLVDKSSPEDSHAI